MRDEPARDAVKRGLLDTFRGAWTDSEYEATFGPAADAVLAALGIPPEMATSEISAALTLLDHMTATWTEGGPSRLNTNGAYVVNAAGRGWAYGASPAAAIHALNAKLEEADRA